MDPELKKMGAYMRDFGCSILGRAVYDATFSEHYRPYKYAISVTLAAHAAEIIVKARIAQEHPLLVFDTLPKTKTAKDLLGVTEIFEHGRAIIYSELPETLWASTGYRMRDVKGFLDFGNLRNKIIHLAPPTVPELSNETLRFAITVIDPMIQDFWDDTVIEYLEVWDDVIIADGYLEERLDDLNLDFTDNAREAIRTRRPNGN